MLLDFLSRPAPVRPRKMPCHGLPLSTKMLEHFVGIINLRLINHSQLPCLPINVRQHVQTDAMRLETMLSSIAWVFPERLVETGFGDRPQADCSSSIRSVARVSTHRQTSSTESLSGERQYRAVHGN